MDTFFDEKIWEGGDSIYGLRGNLPYSGRDLWIWNYLHAFLQEISNSLNDSVQLRH